MSKLYGVVNGVYYCNMERTKELSDRMYERNVPSQSLEPQYTMRPVQTRFTRMAILDQRNQGTVPLNKFAPYNVGNQFNPGSGEAPWSGFATNINEESKLRNLFFALQKCEQPNYIPSSQSDMYKSRVPSTEYLGSNNLLFKNEEFSEFNPNTCDVGNDFFHNNTRVQRMSKE